MQQPVLVVKLGSAVITGSNGIDSLILNKLAGEVAHLSKDYRLVLVSSGAVGCGKAFIQNYKGTLIERKAAAAVGNPILIQHYAHYFSAYNITVAQALCERHHFSQRRQFLQLVDTFTEFWKNDILPIVNENDLVSNVELKFSDNDELATLMAIAFNAEALIICTSVGGFLDAGKNILPTVPSINDEILGFVSASKSDLGLGGMLSKLTFTRLATSLGIKVIMCGLRSHEPLRLALSGHNGTTFLPQRSNLKARQKWLASGSITLGGIYVDKGAEKALAARKSLLTVGIDKVEGTFKAAEVVQLKNNDDVIIGVARVKLSATEISGPLAKSRIAAHADDIVMF